MAAASGSKPKSVIDDLKSLYTQIGNLMLDPDAGQHQQFIGQLQQAVLKYIQTVEQKKAQAAAQQQQQQAQQAAQAQQQQAQQAAGGQQGGQPQPGQQGTVGGPSMAGGGQAPPPGMGGAMGNAVQANPDELRRMLGQGMAQ